MSELHLTVPDSLLQRAENHASQDGVSLEAFVAVALAEKVAVMDAGKFLHDRAVSVSRERFEEILARTADVPPEEFDKVTSSLRNWVDEKSKG